MNYLKNKKYYILVSLFCLCYALGTQKVAAANGGTKNYNVTLNVAEGGKITAKISGGDNNVQDIELTLSGQNTAYNISWFVGGRYFFITRNPDVAKHKMETEGKFYKIKLTKLLQFTVAQNSDQEITHNKVLAYKPSGLWGSSFILTHAETNQTFSYREGLSGEDAMEVTSVNGYFYKATEPASGKPSLLEVDKTNKKIHVEWYIPQNVLQKANKDALSLSDKGKLFDTLTVKNNSKNHKYKNYHCSPIIGICTVVLAIAVYVTFRKTINQKLKNFVDQYIL